MSAPTRFEAAKRLGPLEIVTLILSIYVLIALFLQSVFHLPAQTNALIEQIDLFVCLVFLADFFTRLSRAPSKLKFLKWGWIDFISSIPMLDLFRVGRVVRIICVFRILRAFRSAKNLLGYLLRERKTTSLAAVATISIVLVIFSAIAMLQFETLPDSNIKTPADALWWAFATVTTVGYGDKFPVSAEGRIVACFLMIAGVGLYGTFTGFIASMFFEPECEQEETEHQELMREIKVLHFKIETLESKLGN